MMNQRIKDLWVKALRSQEYEQGHGKLRCIGGDTGESNTDTFCCLGVLSDLYAKEPHDDGKYGEWRDDMFVVYDNMSTALDSSEVVLPDTVAAWAGFENDFSDHGGVNPEVNGVVLASLNDGETDVGSQPAIPRHSFTQIAELIEKYL